MECLQRLVVLRVEAENVSSVLLTKRMLEEKRALEWKAWDFEGQLLEDVECWRNGLGGRGYEFTLKQAQVEVRKTRIAREVLESLLQEALRKNNEKWRRYDEEWRKYNEARRKYREARAKKLEKMSKQRPDIIAEAEKEENVQVDQVEPTSGEICEGISLEATLEFKQEICEEVVVENKNETTGESDMIAVSIFSEDMMTHGAPDDRRFRGNSDCPRADCEAHAKFERRVVGEDQTRMSIWYVEMVQLNSSRVEISRKRAFNNSMKLNWKKRRKEGTGAQQGRKGMSSDTVRLNWKKRRKAA